MFIIIVIVTLSLAINILFIQNIRENNKANEREIKVINYLNALEVNSYIELYEKELQNKRLYKGLYLREKRICKQICKGHNDKKI